MYSVSSLVVQVGQVDSGRQCCHLVSWGEFSHWEELDLLTVRMSDPDTSHKGRGFSNPAYSLSEETEAPVVPTTVTNGLTRSNSLDQDPDHIEVSLEEGASNPEDEVLQRAAGFFVDNNENYKVSWAEASHRISDSSEDPSRPPSKGMNKEYLRWRLRRLVESIYFRLTTIILILIDLIIITVDLAMGRQAPFGLKIADFVFSLYFVLEIVVRIVAITPPAFFVQCYNTIDFVIVFSTFIISCVALNGQPLAEGLALFTVLRFIRIVRIYKIYAEKQHLQTGFRQLISQNKRRYQQDGFDLDLTYVSQLIFSVHF